MGFVLDSEGNIRDVCMSVRVHAYCVLKEKHNLNLLNIQLILLQFENKKKPSRQHTFVHSRIRM